MAVGATAYGAFLFPTAAGGYILVAVLTFFLGSAVTLLCLRIRANGQQTGGGTAPRQTQTAPSAAREDEEQSGPAADDTGGDAG